jgi:hypothetical protein
MNIPAAMALRRKNFELVFMLIWIQLAGCQSGAKVTFPSAQNRVSRKAAPSGQILHRRYDGFARVQDRRRAFLFLPGYARIIDADIPSENTYLVFLHVIGHHIFNIRSLDFLSFNSR